MLKAFWYIAIQKHQKEYQIIYMYVVSKPCREFLDGSSKSFKLCKDIYHVEVSGRLALGFFY